MGNGVNLPLFAYIDYFTFIIKYSVRAYIERTWIMPEN